jgi:hypothetical protein
MSLPLRAGLVLALGVLPASQSPPPLAELLAQAGRYVEDFKQAFRVVISDERYQQRLRRTEERDSRSIRSGGRRDIRSEMLFLSLTAERTWLTIRRVQRVDGRAITDSRERIEDILAEAAPARAARLRQLLDESARFNLGQLSRNFSDPTLVLQFLQPAVQSRFAFTLAGAASIKGVDAWRIDFVEHGSPTVVTLNGAEVRSRGSIWVSRDGATVIETELAQSNPAIHLEARTRVSFRPDASIEMWVPVRMEEGYKQQQLGWWGTPPRTAVVSETIECVATYSNFRRFETAGRIVPPPG